MKKALLILVLTLSSIYLVRAQESIWKIDMTHSKMTFTVTHLSLSEVDGVFKDFSATITSSKEDFSDAVFEGSADLTNVTTNNERRDAHLQREDMFNTQEYPTLTFKSTGIKKTGENTFKLTGNLSIKGITKEVVLDLKLVGTGAHPRSKKEMAGFKVTGTINRTDFGVGNMPSMMVSEDVELVLSGQFVKE